jgi:plasmid stabilization system protein ParE
MIVRYRARALANIDDIYAYLHERNPRGAQSVLRAILEGVDLIGARPLASPSTQRAGIRVKLITRYSYKIFYRIVDDTVVIIHIRHMSRRPWP